MGKKLETKKIYEGRKTEGGKGEGRRNGKVEEMRKRVKKDKK